MSDSPEPRPGPSGDQPSSDPYGQVPPPDDARSPYGSPPYQQDPSAQQGSPYQGSPYQQDSPYQQAPPAQGSPYQQGAPAYQQGGYPPYAGAPGAGYGAPARPGTDGFAIGSLVSGIAGLTVVPFLGSLAAIVLGIVSLSRIRDTGQDGRGMAITGIVLGGVAIVLGVILLVLAIAVIGSIDPSEWQQYYRDASSV